MHPRLHQLLASHPSGVFTGVPAADYHASPGVSRSHLAKLTESPFELHHSLTDPDANESTSQQNLGTILDRFIEQGNTDTLPDGYTAIPDISLNSKEGRKIKADNPSRVLIKDAQINTARACFEAIMKHRRIAKMLGESQRQLSVYSDFGVSVAAEESTHSVVITRRCRPDIVPPESYLCDGYTFMLDLKTTSCDLSSPRNWWYEVKQWGYFEQAGWYLAVCRAAGLDRTLFGHLAVETHAPYRVRCFSLDPVEVEAAYQECLRLLTKLVACCKADSWDDDADLIKPLISPYAK